jgi:hypothetical protein
MNRSNNFHSRGVVPVSKPSRTSSVRAAQRAMIVAALAMLTACSSASFASDTPFIGGTSSGEQYDTRDGGRTADATAPVSQGNSLCKRSAATCDDVGKGCSAGTLADAGAADAGKEPSPETCRLELNAKASCSANGVGIEGGACQSATDCGEGLECIRYGGRVDGQCRAYCCAGTCSNITTSDGSNGKAFCDIQFAKSAAFKVPVCMPVRACRLFEKGACASGETCAVVNEDDGTTGCVELGPAQVGQSCDEVHCGEGLTCLGRTGARQCFQLCKEGVTTCPAPARCVWPAPTFKVQGTGICVDSTMKATRP